jgi:hypothetical protein
MTRNYLFMFPYIFWIVTTIVYIEIDFFDSIEVLSVYLIISFFVALILEYKRNNIKQIHTFLTRAKKIQYVACNLIVGLVAGPVLLITTFPLDIIFNPLGKIETGISSFQAYIFTGYILLWFIVNSLILKVHDRKSIILFIISLLIVMATQLLLSIIGLLIAYYVA